MTTFIILDLTSVFIHNAKITNPACKQAHQQFMQPFVVTCNWQLCQPSASAICNNNQHSEAICHFVSISRLVKSILEVTWETTQTEQASKLERTE